MGQGTALTNDNTTFTLCPSSMFPGLCIPKLVLSTQVWHTLPSFPLFLHGDLYFYSPTLVALPHPYPKDASSITIIVLYKTKNLPKDKSSLYMILTSHLTASLLFSLTTTFVLLFNGVWGGPFFLRNPRKTLHNNRHPLYLTVAPSGFPRTSTQYH